VAEVNIPAGWDLTSATCDDGSPVTAISLQAGETVTCTFTDTKRGHILVDKVTVGGDSTSFEFDPSYGANFFLTDAAAPNDSGPLVPGTYSVAEVNIPAGWDLTSATCDDGSPVTAISLQAGETVTCTLTNTKRATVIVKKVMVGGTDTFTYSGTPSGSISANNGTIQASVAPGQYTSTETVPGGWDLTGIVCDDANSSGNVGTATATFNAEAGETVTCTFTNTKRGTIIVRKLASGSDATFSFPTTSGTDTPLPNPISILTVNHVGTSTNSNLKPGSYTITETFLSGWVFDGVACTVTFPGAGGSVVPAPSTTDPAVVLTLAAGATIRCDYSNSAPLTTRTQGFWATHRLLLEAVWNGGTIGGHTFAGVADKTLCGATLTTDKVLGGFWAGISKQSDGDKRDAQDQAKMRLLQQLLAAILNNAAFGSAPTTVTIADAKAIFCDPNATLTQINNAASAMAAFNESGDSGLFTPGVAANGKDAKSNANIAYWDLLP
jgi:hypothetical protein